MFDKVQLFIHHDSEVFHRLYPLHAFTNAFTYSYKSASVEVCFLARILNLTCKYEKIIRKHDPHLQRVQPERDGHLAPLAKAQILLRREHVLQLVLLLFGEVGAPSAALFALPTGHVNPDGGQLGRRLLRC